MTKQEKIKEAYGDRFNHYKPDECGWSSKIVYEWNEVVDNDFCTKAIAHGMYRVRPSSLSGIEQNNGWIKIESEVDLPTDDIRCEFIKDTGEQLYGRFENRMGGLFVDESKRFEHPEYRKESITHYQPIQKPQPPIY